MMVLQDCSSIRELLLSYIGEQTEVVELRDECVVTLPFKTVDDRWIDVDIEKRAGDFYLVHDGGKTVSELQSHGLRLTESKIDLLTGIADRFGAHIMDGVFRVGCKINGIQEAIIAIGQCASLGMLDVLRHSPNFAQIPLIAIVGKELDSWSKKSGALVSSRVEVQGVSLQHTFDFVCYPPDETQPSVAVTILKPSYTAMSTAKLYAYMILDLHRSKSSKWKKLVVLDKGNEWTEDSVDLIQKFAQKVLPIGSAQDAERLSDSLPSALNEIAA